MTAKPPAAPWRRKFVAVGVLVSVCFGIVISRAIWEGRSSLQAGDAAHVAHRPDKAMRHWRRSARWYVPGAPHVDEAYDRLEALASAAHEAGDVDMSLSAWRAVRGCVLATRSFYTPHEDRLERANQRIAALMAEVEGPGADPSRDLAGRTDWHYQLLVRDESPSVLWSLIALAGFALWLAAAIVFAMRGVSQAEELVTPVAIRCGAAVILGMFLWLLGLSRA